MLFESVSRRCGALFEWEGYTSGRRFADDGVRDFIVFVFRKSTSCTHSITTSMVRG